jgi:hypothetical protein
MNTRKVKTKLPADPATRGFTQRRDGGGHTHPKFEADLLERMRTTRKEAVPGGPEKVIPGATHDPLAVMMGKDFVRTATSGEDESMDHGDVVLPDEKEPGASPARPL